MSTLSFYAKNNLPLLLFLTLRFFNSFEILRILGLHRLVVYRERRYSTDRESKMFSLQHVGKFIPGRLPEYAYTGQRIPLTR